MLGTKRRVKLAEVLLIFKCDKYNFLEGKNITEKKLTTNICGRRLQSSAGGHLGCTQQCLGEHAVTSLS